MTFSTTANARCKFCAAILQTLQTKHTSPWLFIVLYILLVDFIYQVSQKNHPTFRTIVLLEYHINDTENCLVLFPVRPIWFSNLPGFKQPFLPIKMGDILQKASFENLQKRVKASSKIFLCSPSEH